MRSKFVLSSLLLAFLLSGCAVPSSGYTAAAASPETAIARTEGRTVSPATDSGSALSDDISPAVSVPTISRVIFPAQELCAGNEQQIQVVFTENIQTGFFRQWWVELSCTTDEAEFRLAGRNIGIQAGAWETTEAFCVVFPCPGSFHLKVRVFDTEGGKLLNTAADDITAIIYPTE